MKDFFYSLAATSEIKINQLPHAKDNSIEVILNIVFGIAGGLALVFVVIGGLRYILSQGDPNATAQAKNTILYALIGLVITVSAYAIVRFVVSSVT